MLNQFPELLSFSFFAPTALRVAAAVALGYTAYTLIQKREEVHASTLPIMGKPPVALVWISCSITALVAAALLLGYGTQIGAALGGLIGLKYASIPKRLAHISPLSRGAYWLVAVICFSLLITGAGMWAFDVRL